MILAYVQVGRERSLRLRRRAHYEAAGDMQSYTGLPELRNRGEVNREALR